MTGTIRIFPSVFPGEPLETHEASGLFGEWLASVAPCYVPGGQQPIRVTANGLDIPPEGWAALAIEGVVDIRVLPQGGSVRRFWSYVIFPNFTPQVQFARWSWSKVYQGTPSMTDHGVGRQIDQVGIRANQARLGQIIPEIAGKMRVYPDYLLPSHRYFLPGGREQALEMMLCIGKGQFQIPISRVFVGDTPMISLGSNATFAIYEPGADVSASTAATWWHSAPEVSATSTMGAGIELRATSPIPATPTASAFSFSGFSVSIPAGAGSFPAGWTAGMLLRIEQYLGYEVIDGGAGHDIIRGATDEQLEQLQPFAGMRIEIRGENSGTYTVHSYTPPAPGQPAEMTLDYDDGSPVYGLLTGSRRMAIGYLGMMYRIIVASTSSITVERLTDAETVDSGWGGFATLTTVDAVLQLDLSAIEGDWAGPFAACPEGEVTDKLELDFFFPAGLRWSNKDGDIGPKRVDVDIHIGPTPTGPWIAVATGFSDRTLDQLGFTVPISLPTPMRPFVRVRRRGASRNSQYINEKAMWYAMKAKLPAPASYAGVTTMTVKLMSGTKLSAQSENMVSVEGTRILPRLTAGNWAAPGATRQIADWFGHVARSVGYSTGQIDMDALSALSETWAVRGDYYDWAHDEMTVKEAIDQTLGAGFSELTVEGGRLKPIRDEPRTVFEQMYTPQNMLDEGLSREVTFPSENDADGVDVEYLDAVTNSKATVECRLPGDIGSRPEKITLNGVTDRTRAWRIGMRIRRASAFRRWQYSFQTEMDARNSQYMGYVALADDIPGYGKSCLLLDMVDHDGTLAELTVSEPLEWQSGLPHVIAIRKDDGSFLGPFPAIQGPQSDRVLANIPAPWPEMSLKKEPIHVLFGTSERLTFPALIKGISVEGEKCSVNAVNYDVRVYADDNNSPPT